MKRNSVFHLSNAPVALPVICLCIILPSHAADFEPGGVSTDVVISFGEPVTTASTSTSISMSTTLTSTTSISSSSTTSTSVSTTSSSSSSTSTTTSSSSSTTGEKDFGDAPLPGVTLLSDDGARHTILSHFFMGAGVDAETNGLPSANADGDDIDGVGNDEDGWLLADVLYPGNAGEFGVTVSSNGYIQGWLDFNQDGQWQEGVEHIFSNRFVMAGATNLQFFVPISSTSGATIARFRLSTIPGIGVTGLAPDGEVEDHVVFVEPPPMGLR